MTERKSNGVRKERSGWRDEELSRRHRDWGWDCPAKDLDFLLLEYNHSIPVAVVEYKHWRASAVDPNAANYKALRNLANGYSNHDIDALPCLIARYWKDPWRFIVRPINGKAKECFKAYERLTEREYVSRLYMIRGLRLKKEDRAMLDSVKPSDTDINEMKSELRHA